ncbi:Oxidoreductase [Pseudomonas sp. FeS53a]|uniref:aldo/keto reductase n=1 Tax=Pseudomonas sp. FeS53a TaxID=1604022 RepID=UPI0005CA5C1D|nr:aldo/keto reductase [Pseudomonas sp. FeS53a]KIV73757.1 Oxidoreductase [Pseudomonas sp. FeS53a]
MSLHPTHARALTISPIVLGGNVFGWTLDEARSRRLLDASLDAGLTSIDTADLYSAWASGNSGGESECIIGNWLASRPGERDRITLFTKVGAELSPTRTGLSRHWINQAVEDSLRRLRTDYIDLYFSHYPDPETPHEETLRAYEELIRAGKVRAIGASNFSPEQLRAAWASADHAGLPAYSALQVEYNLYDRARCEADDLPLAAEQGCVVTTYFSLASGFLTGKYRRLADLGDSARREDLEKYFDDRGMRILAALDAEAERLDAAPGEVALAWLRHQPGVTAPIASATSEAQLASLVRAGRLTLDAEGLARLDAASRPGA